MSDYTEMREKIAKTWDASAKRYGVCIVLAYIMVCISAASRNLPMLLVWMVAGAFFYFARRDYQKLAAKWREPR